MKTIQVTGIAIDPSLMTFLKLIDSRSLPSIEIRAFYIDYLGEGTGLQFYNISYSYKQDGYIYIKEQTLDVNDQDELAEFLCFKFFGKHLRDMEVDYDEDDPWT